MACSILNLLMRLSWLLYKPEIDIADPTLAMNLLLGSNRMLLNLRFRSPEK